MDAETCATCKFFKRGDEVVKLQSTRADPVFKGICRFMPPTSGHDSQMASYAVVSERTISCGMYRAAPVAEAQAADTAPAEAKAAAGATG